MLSSASLPYLAPPPLPVELPIFGEITLTVFGPLAAIGVFVGHRVALGYAKRHALDLAVAERMLFRVLLGGFAMAHWVSILAYYPERAMEDPWVLIDFTSGLSSVGGFIGGTLVFAYEVRRQKLDAKRYADMLALGLLLGFNIGRLGCTLVHDHPGALADNVLAVGPWPDGTMRYDLGLIEFVALVPLSIYALRRRALPAGQLTARIVLLYALGRFPLDFLRAEDVRYLGLTTAQYATLAFAAIAALLATRGSPRAYGPRS